MPISILYNTDLVKPGDLPKTLDDLVKSKMDRKDHCARSDPSYHDRPVFWNLASKFKGDKWLDYVKALAKQKPILVESLAPVTTTIIKGEALVGITYIKYIKQYKGPVAYVPMDKYLTDPNYLSLGREGRSSERGETLHRICVHAGGAKRDRRGRRVRLGPGNFSADQGRRESGAADGLHGQPL